MSNNSLFSTEGKTAIVTGATGYLGQAITEALLESGAKVDIYGRGQKTIDYHSKLSEFYGKDKVDFHMVDLYDEEPYRKALKDTVENNKSVDILINNAYEFSKSTGFNDNSGRVENISKDQWLKSFESGVYWASLATQVIAEQMKKQKSGSIINISSMYGIVSPHPSLYEGSSAFNPPSYSAAKSAIIALTRYTASFYGCHNVRCNAIAPGAFPNVRNNSYNSPDPKLLERLSSRTVLNRYGDPDDLKGSVVFLASDASTYVTGHTLVVDGGWTIT
tara:strand:- start:11222 stop:12049 length:828 start_codon:yes stop_codon:yes gene_type:complete